MAPVLFSIHASPYILQMVCKYNLHLNVIHNDYSCFQREASSHGESAVYGIFHFLFVHE